MNISRDIRRHEEDVGCRGMQKSELVTLRLGLIGSDLEICASGAFVYMLYCIEEYMEVFKQSILLKGEEFGAM